MPKSNIVFTHVHYTGQSGGTWRSLFPDITLPQEITTLNFLIDSKVSDITCHFATIKQPSKGFSQIFKLVVGSILKHM